MSKSPNYLLPGLGVLGVLFGVAYGLPTRSYKAEEAKVALLQAEQAEARAAELAAQLEEAEAAKASMVASLTQPAPAADDRFGLGRAAHAEEIAAWDVDILPDGRGLPEGSGNAFDGEEVFAEKCASCHGDFAEGVDNWPVLAGGFDTLGDEDPVKTVGSYWPHLSTVYDYVYRSMPFGEAGTLTPDETYAIVAYILYSNDLIDDEFELSHENFSEFEMYNATGFVIDDRPELEYSQWRAEPCMENCKDEVQVTMRSVFLVETPPEGGSNSIMNHAREEALPSFTATGPSFIPEGSAPAPQVASAAPAASAPDGGADLVAAGEKAFKKCSACHKIGDGAKNGVGPHLNGLLGRPIGGIDGFKYSNVFKAAAEDGRIWDEESLTAFLAKPKEYFKGTKMSFAGFKKAQDIAAVIAYLEEAAQ